MRVDWSCDARYLKDGDGFSALGLARNLRDIDQREWGLRERVLVQRLVFMFQKQARVSRRTVRMCFQRRRSRIG